jgi:superfamily II DNA/RNA helicase
MSNTKHMNVNSIDDGYDSDGAASTSSNKSNVSNISNVSKVSRVSNRSSADTTVGSSSNRGGSTSSSGSSSIHYSLDGSCSIDIEQENRAESTKKLTLFNDFSQLGQGNSEADGLLQCLNMYGFEKPLKLQQHAIPAVAQSLGRNLGEIGTVCNNQGKSCVVIQGPSRLGKTSSLVLGLLAAIDTSIRQVQAILLTPSDKRDFDKYFGIFTLMYPVVYQSFPGAPDDSDIDPNSEEVKAAESAHILVGHPSKILRVLSTSSIRLDFVRLIALDDAEEVIYHEIHRKDRMPENRGSHLPAVQKEASLVDTVVQIRHVVECRQYSHNHTDTVRIREGTQTRIKTRHVIVTQELTDTASRKVLRLLKNSLMKKKNLLSVQTSAAPPTKLIKAMKHFFVQAPRNEWIKILAGLTQSLMFPRALVYCDDDNREQLDAYLSEMVERRLKVSANLPATADPSSPRGGPTAAAMSGTMESRRQAVQDFTSNKTQFLLTTSEPAVCQLVLPKVSCVFHIGVPSDLPSVYGVRLLPLDERLSRDSVSVLFVDSEEKGSRTKTVACLEKLFDIKFMDMPFEFIPSTPAASLRPQARRSSKQNLPPVAGRRSSKTAVQPHPAYR